MSNIIEAGDLPEQEKVYLKKDFMGYRVVNPIKNPDGTTNYFNLIFGSKRNLVFLIICLSLLIWVKYDVSHQLQSYEGKCDLAMNNPIQFCQEIGFYNALEEINNKTKSNSINFPKVNISEIKFNG